LPQSGKIFVTLDGVKGNETRIHGFGVNFACLHAKFMTKPKATESIELRLKNGFEYELAKKELNRPSEVM
jgi:hypothetical protein